MIFMSELNNKRLNVHKMQSALNGALQSAKIKSALGERARKQFMECFIIY